MVELSSYLKPVQVSQTSTDQYHESSLSPVINVTRPCFVCVCVCVHVCVCEFVWVSCWGTSSVAQSIVFASTVHLDTHWKRRGCPPMGASTKVFRGRQPTFSVVWTGTPSTHWGLQLVSIIKQAKRTGWGFTRSKKKKKKKHPIRLESLQFRIIEKQKQIVTIMIIIIEEEQHNS